MNQAVHDKKLTRLHKAPRCSKYPPAFGIDLLIDDQEGVLLEAQRYGFNMVWVKWEETNWIEQVKAEYWKVKRL